MSEQTREEMEVLATQEAYKAGLPIPIPALIQYPGLIMDLMGAEWLRRTRIEMAEYKRWLAGLERPDAG